MKKDARKLARKARKLGEELGHDNDGGDDGYIGSPVYSLPYALGLLEGELHELGHSVGYYGSVEEARKSPGAVHFLYTFKAQRYRDDEEVRAIAIECLVAGHFGFEKISVEAVCEAAFREGNVSRYRFFEDGGYRFRDAEHLAVFVRRAMKREINQRAAASIIEALS